jgi:hypothetical protein
MGNVLSRKETKVVKRFKLNIIEHEYVEYQKREIESWLDYLVVWRSARYRTCTRVLNKTATYDMKSLESVTQYRDNIHRKNTSVVVNYKAYDKKVPIDHVDSDDDTLPEASRFTITSESE